MAAGRCCSPSPSPPLRARPTRQRNRPGSACRLRTGRRPPEIDDKPTPSASPFADRSTDELFDPASLHTFEFTVAESDLQFLDSDPTAEEYVPATMTFEGETIEVGLRYKDRSARCGMRRWPQPVRPEWRQELHEAVDEGEDQLERRRRRVLWRAQTPTPLDESRSVTAPRAGRLPPAARDGGCCSSIDPRPSGRQRQVRRVVRSPRTSMAASLGPTSTTAPATSTKRSGPSRRREP